MVLKNRRARGTAVAVLLSMSALASACGSNHTGGSGSAVSTPAVSPAVLHQAQSAQDSAQKASDTAIQRLITLGPSAASAKFDPILHTLVTAVNHWRHSLEQTTWPSNVSKAAAALANSLDGLSGALNQAIGQTNLDEQQLIKQLGPHLKDVLSAEFAFDHAVGLPTSPTPHSGSSGS